MYTILILLVVMVILFFIITGHPKFGETPKGERLARIKNSPNFKNGKFQNLSNTPQMSEEAKFSRMFKEFLFSKNKKPDKRIPSIKTDLFTLDSDKDVLVWFGHSSYFIQIDGKRMLVDPVFSGHASPFPFAVKAFPGSNIYTPDEIPEIDYLIITHDHWDHLDYKTILELEPKINAIVTGLGVGQHFEKWGFEQSVISELDWFEKKEFDGGFIFHCTPSRHFSGRGFSPKKTLWSSFVLQTASQTIFIGGDGGYDSHFNEIGERFGSIDLAILENGQYNKAWKYIHLMPEQVLQAAKDLNAQRLFPVHNSKFALANHPWDEPLKRLSKSNKHNPIPIITPQIGEIVYLKDPEQKLSEWWS